MKYIDIHCHLDFPDYGAEISGVLERMKEGEVGAISIGTDLESSKRAIKIAEENESVWACIGVHPVDETSNDARGTNFEEKEFEELVKSASWRTKVVAVGECGLDWFRIPKEKMQEERKRQSALFEAQINFALKHDKPLMLHCRNSYDDVLDILEVYKREHGEKLRGNSHFFAGNIEQAKRFLDIGFTLSFTGVVTFTNDYDEVIKFIPDDSIMSETDSPFVAPVPHRGKRNEPVFVKEVVARMAQIRGESEEEMAKKLLQNARNLFSLA
jgi:TatD DNase family protein